ncbi:MAG: hypothetical protein ATN36_01295 [Epulopiscium sp. Nele67-Bin005]|nr:MAG: hypothetical protein ATN36_01295 [Epulopiscium sp. Nele67-Bin005]
MEKEYLALLEKAKTNVNGKDYRLLLENYNMDLETVKFIKDVKLYLKEFPKLQVMLVSYVCVENYRKEFIDFFLDLVRDKRLEFDYCRYLYYQVWAMAFRLNIKVEYKKLYQSYKKLYMNFTSNMEITLAEPEKCIVIITVQMLNDKHGPTRNTLDHAYILQEVFGYKVMIISTLEIPIKDNFSMVTSFTLNYNKHIEGAKLIRYQGIELMCYQPLGENYTQKTMYKLVGLIYNQKPCLVYNMGGNSLVADACSKFTQVMTLPFGYHFPVSMAKNLILPRSITEADENEVSFYKKRGHNILESNFMFKLKEVDRYNTRKDFNIPEDKYVVAIVGTRLQAEIKEEFVEILNRIIELVPAILIVFIGEFKLYEERIQQYPILEASSKYLGMQDNLKEVFPICDLYINPIRRGGGTSAVEALSEGVPVVTFGNCDVAFACGSDFVCEDEEQYIEKVIKYRTDKSFYEEQKQNALRRANTLFDTEGMLRDLLLQVETKYFNQGENYEK